MGGLWSCLVQRSGSTSMVRCSFWSLNAVTIFGNKVDCRSKLVHDDGIQIAVLISLRWTFVGFGCSCMKKKNVYH